MEKTITLILAAGSWLVAINATVWLSKDEYKGSWAIFILAMLFYINALVGTKKYFK